MGVAAVIARIVVLVTSLLSCSSAVCMAMGGMPS